MQIIKAFTITLCAVVLCGMMATKAKADDWNKKTTVAFDNPVQIPGQVLDPGTYVFKLADLSSDRNVVEVWSQDGSNLLATIKTIPVYYWQTRPTESVFTLDQSSGGPAMLNSWIFQGSGGQTYGETFVYPTLPTQEAMNTANGR